MASSFFLSLICLFPLLFLISSSSSSFTATKRSTITIPLSKSQQKPSPSSDSNPWQLLNHLASSSLARAHHLKHPHHNTSSSSVTKTALFPRSYGGYSISLSFGTPPQTLPFVMDTGSSLVWFPCTHRYVCTNCSFPKVNPKEIVSFVPKLSSSSKILGCRNSKCGWIFDPDVKSRCSDCDPNSDKCSQNCPVYVIQYGSGATIGLLLLENLDFPEKIVPDFLVGCSLVSDRQPEGIAGFGRGKTSVPEQMGLEKFSYCLVSHKFDDIPVSSDLVLDGGASDSGHGETQNVSYTPFVKNPISSNSAFDEYYYVTLRKITVGEKHVKVPYRFLVSGPDGYGGTIVDSGTTFTFMDSRVFNLVAGEFERQMSNYTRASDIEILSGLRPCFNISRDNSVVFPELIFQFKGGAKMVMPLADYFSFVGYPGVVCMTIVASDSVAPAEGTSGPSIILGNYQQQNYYMEFDLKHERLGFRRQICK